MGAVIQTGSVFDVLPTLPAGHFDCAVTSPPYWMLRSYLSKGHPLKPLELGSEPTPAEYVANQVRVMREVRRVLADHGTVWLNVGDTYSSGGGVAAAGKHEYHGRDLRPGKPDGITAGNLCLIPWRLAIALADDGWLVRSVVVWHKPAPMPSSVSGWMWRRCRVKVRPGWGANGTAPHPGTINGGSARVPNSGGKKTAGVAEWSDCPGCKKCERTDGLVLRRGSWRPTSSWEPVLMLAKRPGYFADGIAVEQPAASATVSRNAYTRIIDDPDEQFAVRHDHETLTTTANLRDVWTIAAEPLREKHYAAFPTELVHRCLKAGTSARGYCPTCGGPWVRVVESTTRHVAYADGRAIADGGKWGREERANGRTSGNVGLKAGPVVDNRTTSWRPSCSCPCPPADPRPGRVLDPFAGSGRTGVEALRLGLDFTGVELNPEYADMARRLLRDESPLFSGT